jgi:hypothetical protein
MRIARFESEAKAFLGTTEFCLLKDFPRMLRKGSYAS